MKADASQARRKCRAWLNSSASPHLRTVSLRAGLRTLPLFVRELQKQWAKEAPANYLPILRCALTAAFKRTGEVLANDAEIKSQIINFRYSAIESREKLRSQGQFLSHEDKCGFDSADQILDGFLWLAVEDAGSGAWSPEEKTEPFSVTSFESGVIDWFQGGGHTGSEATQLSVRFWDQMHADIASLEHNLSLKSKPLLSRETSDWFRDSTEAMQKIWSRDPETWDFWLRWWDGVLSGNQLDWNLQKAVALEIPEEAWSDPKTVAAHIREIEARFRVRENELRAIDYLHAAIADYSFDSIDRVMRLAPFKEDIEHIRTPEKIAAFLADTDVLRDDLELYLRALAAEGGMQWAGFIKTYFQAILEELAQARQLQHLRVGRIINLGKKLESWSADEGVAKEFGPAIDGYREHLKDLRKVVNRHFAATLVRLAPLRDISSGEQDNHWHLLQDMQRGIKALAEPSGDLPPLAREDVEVLLAIVDGVEALLVRHDQLPKGDARSSLRREVDYQMALASVSVALFFERAQEQSGKADKVADVIEKQMKRGLTVGALWKLIRDTFLTP